MSGVLSIGGYGSGYGYSGIYQPYSVKTNQQTPEGDAIAQQSGASEKADAKDATVKGAHKSSPSECQTCKNRKYQDGSDESDVSFKAPGHISPQASAGMVRAHEQQHVTNAYQKAATGEGEVRSVSVTLKTAVCPECGTTYVSGGETRTSIAYSQENPYAKNQKAIEAMNLIGSNIDLAS